jgi:hypothetical protein
MSPGCFPTRSRQRTQVRDGLMQRPFFGAAFDRLFPVFHIKMGEKIGVDAIDFTQVICQDLRVKDRFHVSSFKIIEILKLF